MRDHAPDVAPWTCRCSNYQFDCLCLRHRPLDRRELVWISVTTTSDRGMGWRQITEALPWNKAPRYMIRDGDKSMVPSSHAGYAPSAFGKPTAPASPWHNGSAERLIGSIRRESRPHHCLGEVHLRGILKSYAAYHNSVRTHRSLHKDAPASRPVQRSGVISSRAILGGLHHHYARV